MDLLIGAEEFNDLGLLCQGVDPVRKYNEDLEPEDRKQQTTKDNVPLWDVSCTVKGGRGVTVFKVRVASPGEPVVVPGLIRFGGLSASTYPDGSRNIVRFSADTFTQDPPPSKRSPKADPPAPVAAGAKS
jgi:hypothetical protein